MDKSVLVVHICTILLGTNSLISTTGLWVEVPLMISRLPEGWQLPSYLNVIVQLANIGPILYVTFHWLFPKRVTERGVCFGMLFIGCSASILMALFWDKTQEIFGATRSICLLVLTFCLALVDSLSSVVCLPFMAVLKPKYITSYMIGEGFSGLLPSIISIVQSVNVEEQNKCASNGTFTANNTVTILENVHVQPLISIETFFYMLFVMMVSSSIGFIILNYHPIVKSEYDESKEDSFMAKNQQKIQEFHLEETKSLEEIDTMTSSTTKRVYVKVFLAQMYISGLQYGIMNSLQSFSVLPYGVLSYHLATVLSCLASPIMAVFYVFCPTQRKDLLYVFTFLGTLISGYLIMTAIMSPHPPLQDFILGKFLVVTGWTLFSCLLSYVKVALACLFRDISHTALFWGGVGIQVGGSLGALLMFILIAILNIFQEGCT